MSKQPEMVIARNPRATRNNDTTLNLDNQMYQQPVTSFQRVSNDAPLSEETKTAIQNTVLQFYVHSQTQEDAEGITACYERLSRDDERAGESLSIENQKRILEKYCRDHGYTAIRHYDEDDGFSGTNFNRPGFQRMLADIKAGKIKRVVVKDMSRFGRNYLQVGMYTEMLFPEYGVHFIAVNDGVDSVRGDNEFAAIRNVFNEMYAKDTSKKIRATWQSKGHSGEHLTTVPPYGYIKDPEDTKRWIVDEEAAAVVQKIFALCMDGLGPTQIAKWLKENLTEYYVIGCGRSPELRDEQVSIAYRKDRLNLMEMQSYWLSETPYVPASRYAEQSICPRICNEALFEDLETGKVFRIVNTHLDHIGAQARILGLRQILEKLKTEQLYPDAPTMITGDFNAEPQDPEFEILKEYPEYTNVTKQIGITYHGFTEEDHPCSIDFLLVKGDIKTGEPVKWTDKEGNVWLSDHYPVCVEVE